MSSHNGNGSGTRTKDQREFHKSEIVKFLRRGWTLQRIAEELGLTPSQVRGDWYAVLKEFADEREFSVAMLKAKALTEYEEVKREAWKAWDDSRKESRIISNEETPKSECEDCGGKGKDAVKKKCGKCKGTGQRGGIYKVVKTIKTKEQNVDYLRVVLSCLEGERQLCGLDAPKQLKIDEKKTLQIQWAAFDGLTDDDVPDVITERMRLALMQPQENERNGHVIDIDSTPI